LCGWTLDLEVHHIISRKHGGQDVESNLIALCKDCHDLISEEKYWVWNYPEIFKISKVNRDKYIKLLKALEEPDMRQLIHWSKYKHNRPTSTPDLRLIKRYLDLITSFGYDVGIKIMVKSNQKVRLSWWVYSC